MPKRRSKRTKPASLRSSVRSRCALTVSAERERAAERSEDGFVRFERRFGSFSRAVGVPSGVTEDKVKADYRDGVLEIRVAKPETPKPKKIALGGGHPTIES